MDKKIETNKTLIRDLDICNEFQNQVSKFLVRHKSILDIMTKTEEYNSRINRALAKSVTTCGCISIHAKKQDFNAESYDQIIDKVSNHIEGELCDSCRDVLEEEIGNYLFYLAAFCNTLDLNLNDILKKEYKRNETLGVFSLK